MPCYEPLQGLAKIGGGITWKKSESNGNKMEVACGQCLGCRLDYSRMWASRIVHEASLHEYSGGNSFITLTYDGEKIPKDWSLKKKHFQDFMKRLRKQTEQKIRYFHCGEYGNLCRHGGWTDHPIHDHPEITECHRCNLGRPHYHAILFNRTFKDQKYFKTVNGNNYYTSDELAGVWQKGHCIITEVTMKSAAYVARYCLKKRTGRNIEDHYWNTDQDGVIHMVEPEYATMSRRPGIGKKWFEKYKSDCFPSDEVPVRQYGIVPKVPRYYCDLYGAEHPEELEAVKEKRQQFRRENKHEYTRERLRSKYICKKAQVGQLNRELL